ncbi:hypothetical protein, partial [Serratia marcescens]|uniref:hypothetical protein n=1 Tax=Serratia marcescens TaxID=615 RepID=UPI001C64FC97
FSPLSFLMPPPVHRVAPALPLITLWNTPLKIPYRLSKGDDSVVFIQFIYAENSSFEGRL